MTWLKKIGDRLGLSESTQGVIASAVRGILVVALAVLAMRALILAAQGDARAPETIAVILIAAVLAWYANWLLGITVIIVSAIVAFVVSMMLVTDANAEQIKDGWLPAAGAFLYVEREYDHNHVCVASNSDLNSNLGIDVTAYKRGPVQWHVELTHHSCAFGPDAPDYNALGMGLKWEFYRK